MAAYDVYAKFYDATQSYISASWYLDWLRKHHSEARSVLELACGTGLLLEPLSKHYDVVGLDLSAAMLKQARRRLPKIPLHLQNMAGFRLDRKFDAIICAYDSINHVLAFGDWVKTFKAAERHLNPGGVFLFDINPIFRLQELAKSPAMVQEFDGNTLIMDVTAAGKGVTDWAITVFEQKGGDRYRRHHEVIREVSFPPEKIKTALARSFPTVKVFDTRGGRPRKTSRRLFFMGRNAG